MKSVVLCLCLFLSVECFAFSKVVKIHSVPRDYESKSYTVTVNGVPAPVFNAGLKTCIVSFDASEETEICVSAKPRKSGSPFFRSDAKLLPESEKIGVDFDGDTAKFTLKSNGQYVLLASSSSREFNDECLLIFSNPPEKSAPNPAAKNVIYLSEGVYKYDADLRAGDILYLAAGAVMEGSINVFSADNVKICGRGIVVYKNGKQSEKRDEGWIVRKNWHPLCVDNSKNLKLEGLTFVNRCRTWNLQTRNVQNSEIKNAKVVTVNKANMNGDGIDFYGGSDIKVSDSFFKCADDCVAFFCADASKNMYSVEPTFDEIKNIEFSNCVFWPTFADVIRAGFNGQNLKTENVSFKNCDVLWLGSGFWHSPWSLLCVMTSNGKPTDCCHKDWLFENFRFETPATIWGFANSGAKFSNFVLRNFSMPAEIWTSQSNVEMSGFKYENVEIGGKKVPQIKTKIYDNPKGGVLKKKSKK